MKFLIKIIFLLYASSLCAEELNIPHLKSIIESGKYAEAYELLSVQEETFSGNLDVDYLFALSALESGHVEQSIAVFDRILSINPKFAGARLDLARAYFAVGSYDLARQEMMVVSEENPPPLVLAVVKRYLAAIEEKTKPKVNTVTAYAEMTFGHDSNVNAATSKSSISIPALNNLTVNLASSNLEKSSNYLAMSTGAELTHLVAPNFYVFGGLDLKKKNGFDAPNFNSGSVDGHLGVRAGDEKNAYSLSAQQGRFYLGGIPSRDTTGLTAQWMHAFNAQNQMVLFGAHNWIRFDQQSSKVENMNMAILGGGWIHAFDPEAKFVISPTLMLGKEFEMESRANGDKEFMGARLAVQYRIKNNVSLFGSVGEQVGFHQTENAAFLTKRLDHQYDGNFGAQWQLNNSWSIRPQITYSKNDTNIDIYKYERVDFSLTARWDFK